VETWPIAWDYTSADLLTSDVQISREGNLENKGIKEKSVTEEGGTQRKKETLKRICKI
jgi:hypothetical protein